MLFLLLLSTNAFLALIETILFFSSLMFGRIATWLQTAFLAIALYSKPSGVTPLSLSIFKKEIKALVPKEGVSLFSLAYSMLSSPIKKPLA